MPRAASRCGIRLAGADRRLHGFLYVDRSRAQHCQAVAPGRHACRQTSNGCPSRTTGVCRASGLPDSRCGGRSASVLREGARSPEVGPCARLDYELELGIFIGVGNGQGTRIPVESAEQHVFGLCLLNDWSARDIQAWESVPLGPFLAKNFATTMSPWIVTMDALAPYRAAWARSPDEPQPLPICRRQR